MVPENAIPVQILSIDSSSLHSLVELESLTCAIQPLLQSHVLLILCGSYAGTHHKLLQLVQHAPQSTEQNIITQLADIIQEHTSTLDAIVQDKTSHYYSTTLEHINTIAHHIRSLLVGVMYVKEISNRTTKLLANYASSLSTFLIQAVTRKNHNILMNIGHQQEEPTELAAHSIVAKQGSNHDEDYSAAYFAKKFLASSLIILTHRKGIMSTDPKLVAHARPISHLSYNHALEVAYLGDKILHPTAIQTLKECNIPIHIYSFNTYEAPSTTISSEKKGHVTNIILTNRDQFTILTVRSTQMFNTYGYLESIFQVFKKHKTPVETLTTSEISITIAIYTKYFHLALQKALEQFGQLDYVHEQSLISIVGEHGYWSSPKNVVHILSMLDETVTLNMVSLSQTRSNLTFALHNSHAQKTLATLHATLY